MATYTMEDMLKKYGDFTFPTYQLKINGKQIPQIYCNGDVEAELSADYEASGCKIRLYNAFVVENGKQAALAKDLSALMKLGNKVELSIGYREKELELIFVGYIDALSVEYDKEEGICYILECLDGKGIMMNSLRSEVKVNIDIFAAPATLKKTAGYTMVFQATPPKRPDHSFREWGLGPYWFKDSDCTLVGGHSASGRSAPDNIRNWISLEPVDPVKFRMRMQELHGKNLKTRLYGMPTHLTRLDPEYDWLFKSCALKPGVVWQAKDAKTGKAYLAEPCCAHTPVGDLHVGRLDRLFRDVPELDGIYFDIMHVKNCSNELHGCGVVDAFGKPCTTSIALNLRDYVLRVLKICQKHKRMFWLHAHNAFFPFVHDLADNWMPGEELFSAIEKNPEWGYLEAVTPEAYQSAWNGDVRGISISSIGQLERITRMLDLPESRKHDMRSDEYAVHALAPSVLYDFMVMALGSEHPEHPLFKLWRIRKKVKLNHADFHGYWIDPAASSAPALKTSWYSWPGKAPQPFLLCVVNTGRKTCKTDLKIDWKKLHSAPCELTDLWRKRSFSEKELAEFPLAGHNFMLLVPAKKRECNP